MQATSSSSTSRYQQQPTRAFSSLKCSPQPHQMPDIARSPGRFVTPICHSHAAPSASDAAPTALSNVSPHTCGTENTIPLQNRSTRLSGLKPENSYAQHGSAKKDVTALNMTTNMSAQDAAPSHMEPSSVLERRKLSSISPYKAEAWDRELNNTGLLIHFAKVPQGIHSGFILNFPTIHTTQAPTNSQSLIMYKEQFDTSLQEEI